MGGERETTLEGDKLSPAPPPPPGEGTTIVQESGQRIRIHEANGQVHFHADADHLKVAVPVSEWWKAWERLRAPTPESPQRFSYVDVANSAVVTVTSACRQADNGFDVAISISVNSCSVNHNYRELARFTRK